MTSLRICFFGDSITNGTGDDACLGWVGRLCAYARASGHDVTHYNLGIRRDTSADVLRRWKREAADRLTAAHRGALVFSFGANDCTLGDDNGVRVRIDRSIDNARALLTEANILMPTLMVGPAPISDDTLSDHRVRALSAALGNLCSEIQVPYLPVFEALTSSQFWQAEAAAGDGTHPNTEGYAVLAALVASWPAWKALFKTQSASTDGAFVVHNS